MFSVMPGLTAERSPWKAPWCQSSVVRPWSCYKASWPKISQAALRGTTWSYHPSVGHRLPRNPPHDAEGHHSWGIQDPPGFTSGFWLVLSLHHPERKPLPETFSFMAARLTGIDGCPRVTSNQHDFKYADVVRLPGFKYSMVLTSQDRFWSFSEVIFSKCLALTESRGRVRKEEDWLWEDCTWVNPRERR